MASIKQHTVQESQDIFQKQKPKTNPKLLSGVTTQFLETMRNGFLAASGGKLAGFLCFCLSIWGRGEVIIFLRECG